jgi:hypothetical protein
MKSDQTRYTQRDLLVSVYENGLRTNYILVAVLGAIVGRPFVGSPPYVVASFLLALASVILVLLVILRASTHTKTIVNGRIKGVIGLVGAAQVVAIFAEYLPFNPTDITAALRFAFAGLLFWWAFTIPLVDPGILDELAPNP